MTTVLHSQLKKEASTISLLPTLKFVGVGIVWIVLSDLVLFFSQTAAATHFPIFHIEVLKGILFVFAMGVFFFLMQRKHDLLNREVVDLDLFKKNPQAMFIYNLETMNFLDVNEAATRNYGYSKEEFLSMKVCDIRPKDDMPTLIKSIEQLQNGFRFIGQSTHIHKNGSIIHTEVSAYSITYNTQHAGLVMANDISKQIQAERALIEATKHHEKQTHDKLYEVALFNKELQVRIREINANNDELIEVNKLLQQASRNSAARYEAKFQRMQQSINGFMENVSDVLWMIDLQDNNSTFISDGALAFFGCTRKFILDRPNFWESFVAKEDRLRVKNELLELNHSDDICIQYKLANGEDTISQTIRFVRDEDECVEKIVFAVKTCPRPIPTPKSPEGDFGALSKVKAELSRN